MSDYVLKIALALLLLAFIDDSFGFASETPHTDMPRAVTSLNPSLSPQLSPMKSAQLKAMLVDEKRPQKLTIVNLWATWCAPCVSEMPELIRLAKKNGPRGVKVILLSADEAEDRAKAARLLTESGADSNFAMGYYLDEAPDQFMKPFIPNWSAVVPTTVLFDSRGARVGTWMGEVKSADLQKRIDQLLLQAKAPVAAKTKIESHKTWQPSSALEESK